MVKGQRNILFVILMTFEDTFSAAREGTFSLSFNQSCIFFVFFTLANNGAKENVARKKNFWPTKKLGFYIGPSYKCFRTGDLSCKKVHIRDLS